VGVRQYPLADQQAKLVCYALLITLGSYSLETLPKDQQATRIEQLLELYAKDPSSGVHGASGWLLRQWGQAKAVDKMDRKSVPYSPDREWFVMRFEPPWDWKTLSASMPKAFSITFVVFPAGQYQIGSPASEKDRRADETQVSVKLTRPLAIADREISWQQFSPHDGDQKGKACDYKAILHAEEFAVY
jgi:formylglycine-generating enzyme required for sulfatase activity